MKPQYRPKVSIVIPAYNASNYLAEAIDSALAQTYRNFEIIVVNDGSNDNGATAEVAARYGETVRYFEKENGGSSSALNYGIRNMTGEWFSWLSHDDLYYPQKLEKQILFLNSLNASENELKSHIFFSASNLIDADGNLLRKSNRKQCEAIFRMVEDIPGNEYMVAEPTRYNFHGCSCLIHKSAFEKVGMFDEKLRLLNDVDLWYRLYTCGFKVHYLPDTLVMGRVHSKQISISIGYSYHNPEQDMFWERTLQWLIDNHGDNPELFFLYGRNAYLKTRDVDGDKAYQVLLDLDVRLGRMMSIKRHPYCLYAKARHAAKQIYLKIKA